MLCPYAWESQGLRVQLTAANILGCSSTQPAAADRCGHHSVALGELQLAQPKLTAAGCS